MKTIGVALLLWSLGVGATTPVLLAGGIESIPLAGHIAVLRDEAAAWTLEDVRSPELGRQFVPSAGESFSYGFSRAAHWFRLTLRNPADADPSPTNWVLDLAHPLLDLIDIHLCRADGRVETTLTGDTRPRSPRQLAVRTFAVPLQLEPGEEVTLYIRVQSEGPLLLIARLWPAPAFHAQLATDNLWFGGFLGSLIAMTLYNLIIGARIRDRAYLYYVLMLAAVTVFSMLQAGYVRQYGDLLFDGGAIWLDAQQPVVISLVNLLAAAFVREFINVPTTFPRLDRVMAWMVWMWTGVVLLSMSTNYFVATVVSISGQAFGNVLGLGIGMYLAWKGVRSAQFLMLAWIGFIIAVLLTLAMVAGFLPFNLLTLYGWMVGVFMGVTVLSLALADRVTAERRERARLSRLKQFFAPQVAEAILEEGGNALLAPMRREVTVLFTDLRGFTAFAAQSEPEEVVGVLRQYHSVVAAAAEKHHGNVEQFTGDGVMVFFNAPVDLPEHERFAVQAALDLREAFVGLRQRWRERGHDLGVGIGLASGYATVGAVGAAGRMGYSCTGTVTNLAARLCAQAQDGQILAPKTLLGRINGAAAAEELGEREVKGIPKPVPVCNLLAPVAVAAPALALQA